MCLSKNQVSLFFEYHKKSLKDYNLELKENDIWMIIADVLEFLEDLESRGYYHGEIKPERILLNKKN